MIASKELKLNKPANEQKVTHKNGFFDYAKFVQRNLDDSFLKSSKDFIN